MAHSAKSSSALIVAGEPSGDLHGSLLVAELHKLIPSCAFFGFGGEKMAKEGVELIASVEQLSVMGISEVLSRLGELRRLKNNLLDEVERRQPAFAILIDYPGMNLRLARWLSKRDIPVVYYISPQLWAWHASRVKTIRRYVDRMLVILPFERDFYDGYGISAEYVGHPFVDVVRPEAERGQFLTSAGISGKFVLLLPGSRLQELKRHIPIVAGVVDRLSSASPDLSYAVLRAPGVRDDLFDPLRRRGCIILDNAGYAPFYYADFALVSSGSATLECAVAGLPMAVFYQTSFISYALLRAFIKIDSIALVNIVASWGAIRDGRPTIGGKSRIVEEFIQKDATPDKIAAHITDMLTHPDKLVKQREALLAVKSLLGPPGAAARAAKIIVDTVIE